MLNKLFFPLLFIFSFSASVAQEKSAKNLPIGVFDSGTGGLTVLEALLSLDAFNNTTGAPGADGKPDFEGEYFQYLADQANMPYGNYAAEGKTKLLQEHVIKNMDFLMKSKYDYLQSAQWINRRKQGVKMLVLACNTATAFALNEVKEFVAQSGNDLPVVGVINAGVKAALNYQQSNKGAIGVFATAGTVASNGYSFFDEKANAYRTDYKGPSLKNATYKIDTTLLSIYNFNRSANKLLCEFDNNGSCLDIQLNDPENYVRYHLVTLLENMRAQKSTLPLNTLILGCTHYPFMRDTISRVLHELYNYKKNGNYVYRSVLAEHVELVDPAVETAKEAYVALRALQLQNESVKQKDLFFITVPNLVLNEVKLQPDGWFTYQYKYGRKEGEGKKFVNFVPFDNKNVSPAIYERLKIALPETFKQIQLTITSN